MDRERVRIIYRDSPMFSIFAMYVHCMGNIVAIIYCFILYANLFHYIYTHPVSTKESKQMIAYWINGDSLFSFIPLWLDSERTMESVLPPIVSICILNL